MLNKKDINYILDLISEKEGFGYSNKPEVGKLQAKLSMMLQVVKE